MVVVVVLVGRALMVHIHRSFKRFWNLSETLIIRKISDYATLEQKQFTVSPFTFGICSKWPINVILAQTEPATSTINFGQV
jgi:hypothetical protein